MVQGVSHFAALAETDNFTCDRSTAQILACVLKCVLCLIHLSENILIGYITMVA